MIDSVRIGPNERLLSLTKDYHQRTHHGKHVVWVVTDRFQHFPMLCSGKLSALRAYINERAGAKQERVHLSGLYSTVDRLDGRTGGLYQNRFAVRAIRLEDAAAIIETIRDASQSIVVVASPQSVSKCGL